MPPWFTSIRLVPGEEKSQETKKPIKPLATLVTKQPERKPLEDPNMPKHIVNANLSRRIAIECGQRCIWSRNTRPKDEVNDVADA